MKKILYMPLCFSAILLFACSKNSADALRDTSLIGNWALAETLADPGDGSGTWQPADTAKHYFIQFNADNSIESNLYFHLNNFQKYIVVNDSSITFIDSNDNKFNYYYKIKELHLTIVGGCYEACGSKFIKSNTPQ